MKAEGCWASEPEMQLFVRDRQEMTYNLKQQATVHARFSRRRRAVLPHLGNLILSDLFHAITGNRRIPRSVFKRAVANGLNKEHLEAAIRQAKAPSDLWRLLSSVADNHLQRAIYWQDVGVKGRARDHFLEASQWQLYAALIAPNHVGRAKAFERVQSSYEQAAPQFAVPAETVSITYPGGSIKGYLRVPAPQVDEDQQGQQFISANYPCVLLFNGLSTPKEELHLTENALLATGAATLSFDYPSNGSWFDPSAPELFSFDVEELGNALFLFLAARPEIDVTRVAAFGASIGGRLAIYLAGKLPERLRAVATLSAPLDLLNDMDLLLPAMQRELAVGPECSKAGLFDLARRTPLRPLLPGIATPLLVVGGARDMIAMPEETRQLYEECGASDKKLVICAGAGHGCFEMMPSLRHEIAQWIRQRI